MKNDKLSLEENRQEGMGQCYSSIIEKYCDDDKIIIDIKSNGMSSSIKHELLKQQDKSIKVLDEEEEYLNIRKELKR